MSESPEYARNEIGGIGPGRAPGMAKPRSRVRGSALAKEVFDPLVPSLVVTVDAVGDNRYRRATLCPAQAATWGPGAPALNRQETPAWRKS